jgi:hypothetical protein
MKYEKMKKIIIEKNEKKCIKLCCFFSMIRSFIFYL